MRRSPEDEASSAYLDVDVAVWGTVSLIFSILLILAAFYFSALPHVLDENYFTQKDRKHENGTLYFEYFNEKGENEGGLLGDWFERLLRGEYRYTYGNSFANYCWPRVVPISQWASSIYRATQHKAIVQTLVRTVVLFGITNSLFQTILLAHSALPRSGLVVCSCYAAVFVDLAHSLSSFAMTAIHLWQDEKLAFLVDSAMETMMLTLVLKISLNIYLDEIKMHRLARCFSLASVIGARPILIADVKTFTERVVCDSNACQTRSLKGVRLMACCKRKEYEEVREIREIVKL
ncbi:unnamed protein product [Caenorhabditis auriculariae]|uniref:Uncharacterized protein n=1 Tax=Caenorhabditis auriculariae TaxID=2777116 RepID=A0A8S1HCW2_9PELO|nr:unnamed protein product [Caenorhabditis auriculariae]